MPTTFVRLLPSGQGDYDTAYLAVSRIVTPGSVLSREASWVSFDLVESAEKSGRHVEARRHADALSDAEIGRISPRLAMVEAATVGLVTQGAISLSCFSTALAVDRVERWPFERARVRLAYGEQLRRERATADARGPLLLAHQTFCALGAEPWALRANRALRAAGVPGADCDRGGHGRSQHKSVRSRNSPPLDSQTSRSAHICSCPLRTASAHLYRIFPKLGITTRASLRDALIGLGS